MSSHRNGSVGLLAVAGLTLMLLAGCRADQVRHNGTSERLDRMRSAARQAGIDDTAGAFSVRFAESRRYGSSPVPYYRTVEVDASAGLPTEGLSTTTEVVEYGPVGVLPAEIRRPVVYVLFSEPVVPLARLGQGERESDIMDIVPSVDGTFRWLGTRMLAFEPDAALPGQQEYSVTVGSGGSRQAPFTFQFRDEYLDVVEVHPGGTPLHRYWGSDDDLPPDVASRYTLEFNYDVDVEHLSEYLSIRVDGVAAPTTAQRPEFPDWFDAERKNRFVLLSLDEVPATDAEIEVRLRPGASGQAGSIERPEAVQFGYRTVGPFRFVGGGNVNYGFPGGWQEQEGTIYLEFSHPVKSESLDGRILMNLDGWVDVSEYADARNRVVRVRNLPVSFEQEFEVELAGGILDVYGRRLGQSRVVSVVVPPASGRFTIPNTGSRILEAGFPPRVWFSHRNLLSASLAVEAVEDPFEPVDRRHLGAYDLSEAVRNTTRLEVVDLGPYLNESGTGAVGLVWDITPEPIRDRPARNQLRSLQVQVSDIGITTRYAMNRVLVWAHSLSEGTPLAGARVELLDYEDRVVFSETADSAGLAVIILEPDAFEKYFVSDRGPEVRIVVRSGDDRLVVENLRSHSPYRHGVGNVVLPPNVTRDSSDVYMFTDRGVYRPGETVHVAGVDRVRSAERYSVYEGPFEARVGELWRNEGSLYRTVEARTDADGIFQFSFAVPPQTPPGTYEVQYIRGGSVARLRFEVALFRRVELSLEHRYEPRTIIAGQSVLVTVDSSFLSGGVPSGSEYRTDVRSAAAVFAPREWTHQGYRFGPEDWTAGRSILATGGTVDGFGRSVVSVPTGGATGEGRPYRFDVETVLSDLSAREVAARKSFVVHPAEFYLGLRLDDDRWFVPAGSELDLSIQAVAPLNSTPSSHEGRAAATRNDSVEVRLLRHEWRLSTEHGSAGALYQSYRRVTDVVSESMVSLENGLASFSVVPSSAGSYTVEISTEDDDGRDVVTTRGFYASGSDWVNWSFDFDDQIRLESNKERFVPGETAELFVMSPIENATYLVTVEQSGIIDQRLVEIDGSSGTIEVPIRSEHAPVIYVSIAAAVGRTESPPSEPTSPDLGKPTGFYGLVALEVEPQAYRLEVTTEMDRELYRPGSQGRIRVGVLHAGEPVPDARVLVVGADRGVLDLVDHRIPDPLQHFFAPARFPLAVTGGDSRSLLIDPVLFETRNLFGGGGGGKGESDRFSTASFDPDRRADFSPLALFSVDERTDESGFVDLDFRFPEALTTWRFTAVAVAEDRFGHIESEARVGNPITLRSAMPRTLRPRDSAVIGAILTNLTDETTEVRVGLRISSIDALSSPSPVQRSDGDNRTITVDPGESRRVDFDVYATRAGIAEIRFQLDHELLQEELVEQLVVVQPSAREVFSTTGRVDARPTAETDAAETDPDGDVTTARETVVLPSQILPGSGYLGVTVSSNRLTLAENALSRILESNRLYLDDVLSRAVVHRRYAQLASGLFDDYRFDPESLDEALEAMATRQQADGGLGFRDNSSMSNPMVTARATALYALLVRDEEPPGPTGAQPGFVFAEAGASAAAGAGLDHDALVRYLQDEAATVSRPFLVRLHAAYALSLLSELPPDTLSLLDDELSRAGTSGTAAGSFGHGERGLLGLSHLYSGNNDAGRRIYESMAEYLVVSERSVELRSPYNTERFYDSQVQGLSRMVSLALHYDERSAMVGRIAESLALRQGRQLSSADAIAALLALTELIEVEQLGDTELSVSGSVAGREIIARQFSGVDLSTASERMPIAAAPLDDLPRDRALEFLLSAEGSGSAWYRLSLEYSLPSEVVSARDRGLSVSSRLQTLSGESVAADSVRVGRTYRMQIDLSTSVRRSMVELSIPVPSGMEILDTRLVTTGRYEDRDGSTETRRTRVSADTVGRPRIYDNEVRYLFEDLRPGAVAVEFLVRGTSPGVYPTPPAGAELLYEPEVFGRSDGRLFVIEP